MRTRDVLLVLVAGFCLGVTYTVSLLYLSRSRERMPGTKPMMLSWNGSPVDCIPLCGCFTPILDDGDVAIVHGFTVATDLNAPTSANPAFFARCTVCGQTLKRWVEVPDR